MQETEVEIAIPVYNGGQFIAECIESILSQTFTNFKILISDNCSTDNTVDIINSFEDPRISLHRQTENIGSHANFNFLIAHSTAPFVKLFCADDVMMPWAVERQLQTLKQYPGAVVCSSDMIVTDENLNPTSDAAFLRGISTKALLVKKCGESLSNCIGGPSNILFVGDTLRNYRLDPEFKFISDLIIALEACNEGFYINDGYPSYFYRRHASSGTNMTCDGDTQTEEWARFLIKYDIDDLRALIQARNSTKNPTVIKLLSERISRFPVSKRLRCTLKFFSVRFAKTLLGA